MLILALLVGAALLVRGVIAAFESLRALPHSNDDWCFLVNAPISPARRVEPVSAPALRATSDFYARSPATRLLRVLLSAGQRLWPALAVRAAYRLFGTPLPARGWRRGRGWPPGWQARHWAFERAGITLHERAGMPGAPLALLVHGWGGHARQMLPLADALAACGLRPVLLDLPAHGASPGHTSNLPQFARAIEYAVARLQARGDAVRAVLAHSLAANALAQAAARGLPAPRLVLLAPPASPREYTRLFAHVFGLSEATRSAMERRIEAREGILMPQFEPAAVGARIAAATLVVHDEDDRINRFADGQAFAGAIAGAQLLATRGLGHRRILKEAPVLAQVAAFAAAAP